MKIETISNIVTCPYCGHKNNIAYPVGDYRTNDIIYCDVENGGCDQPFVIINPFRITFTSKILKIEKSKP